MVEVVLIDCLIFLSGTVAGTAIKFIAESIVKKASDNPDVINEQKKLGEKIKWVRFVPAILGLLSLLTWLQPAYQRVPFYIFAANIGLIWFFTLIALIDYFTHLIYPRVLLVGGGLVGVILLAITFLDAPIGVVFDKTLGLPQAVKTNELPKLGTINFVQLWPLSLADSLLGATAMAILFGLFYLFSRMLFRKEVFGGGDVLLAIFIGVALGFQRSIISAGLTTISSLAIAAILLMSRRRWSSGDYFIAYGPFLCTGAIICLMFGSILNH